LLLAAGLAVVLHGLLLSTDVEWMKSKDIDRSNLKPLAITISHKQQVKKTSPDKKSPEEIKKKINKPETPEPPKKIKKTILSKAKKSPPKIKPASPIIKPPSKDISEPILHSEPEWSYEEPSIIEEELDLSGVHKEKESKKTILKETQDEPSEPTPSSIQEAIPVYRKNPSPKYPRMARRRGYEGTVVMEVLVNREGKVKDLRLYESSGYPVLDRSAMNSVKKWLFHPGKRGDKAVDMWVKGPVRFRLN